MSQFNNKIELFNKGMVLLVIYLLLSFFILYLRVILKLIHDWINDSNYSHGFFIPLIACYIIWQRREKLLKLHVKPNNLGLILLLMGLLLLVFGTIGSELFIMRFSMIIVLFALVIYMTGAEFGKRLALPISYLIFMIPLPAIIWNKLAFPLKLFVTWSSVNLIDLFDIPSFREGNIIYLNNTTLQVVDACSGMRSLMSLLALSAAFALIIELSAWKRWFIFISALPIAIILNIVRLATTAVLAQKFGADIAQGFLHEFSGIMIFIFAIVCLYSLYTILKRFQCSSSCVSNGG